MGRRKKNKKVVDGKVMELVAVDGIASGENPEAGLQEPEVPCGRKREHLYMVHAEQFRRIFPEETWVRILNELDPEDHENCANASPYFWELLQNQRTVFLLPKVIDIMALVFEQNYDISKVSTSEGDCDGAMSGEPVAMAGSTNNLINAEEWRKTVLKCRLVCSAWNTAVENCYQKPSMTGIPEFVSELDPRSKLNNVPCIQWTKQKLPLPPYSIQLRGRPRQFLEHFDESHHSGVHAPPKNPFLGRYLVITMCLFGTADLNEITLKKFGKEIWYLEVMIFGIEPSSASAYPSLPFYSHLRSYLQLVPNLKFLKIHSKNPIVQVSLQGGKGTEKIECSPLPTFEKLEILCLKNLGPQIGSLLVRQNCHVAYLKICNMECDEDVENSLEMANLKGFAVVDSRSGEKILENFGPNWKNVKMLCYGRDYEKDDDYYSVLPTVGIGAPEAFAIFQNNWAETLTDLQLQFPFGFDEKTVLEQSKALRLNLPGVRRLTLREFPYVFLDFALPLQNTLEHFVFQFETQRSFCLEYWQRVEREQNIQLVEFEDRMHMSNIWDYFGKLKTIKVEYIGSLDFTLFTKEREKFEYSRKKELHTSAYY